MICGTFGWTEPGYSQFHAAPKLSYLILGRFVIYSYKYKRFKKITSKTIWQKKVLLL
jgi:hypothetical protein